MASLGDIGVAAGFNVLTALAFLLAFAFLRLQPINDRVYFPKWYLRGMRDNPIVSGAAVQKFVNLDGRSYFKFLNWMPAALKMPQDELINHAGLDSVVYLRIYITGYVVCLLYVLVSYTVISCCLSLSPTHKLTCIMIQC
jgi:hypothetical protein